MSLRRSMKISSLKEPIFTLKNFSKIPEDNVNLNFYIGSEATLNLSSNWHSPVQRRKAEKKLCMNCKSLLLETKSSAKPSSDTNKYADKLKRSRSVISVPDVYLKTKTDFRNNSEYKDLPCSDYQCLANIIKSLMFLAKHGIIPDKDENSSNQVQKSFIEFFKLKLNEDTSHNLDIKYFDSKIQASLYQILNDQIVQHIVKEIDNKPFSIVINEIVDVVKGSSIAFIIRYLNTNDVVNERLLSLDSISSFKDTTLKEYIIEKLRLLNLSFDKLVGHAYEGSQNMYSVYTDVISKIKSDFFRASYVQYSAYNLNTILQKSCFKFPEVRDCLSIVDSLFNFIENSCKNNSIYNKRSKCLKETFEILMNLRENQYAESRTDIISLVKEQFGVILDCLKNVEGNDCTAYGAEAKLLFTTLNKFEFVIMVHMLGEILDKTFELSNAIQEIELDLIYSRDLIKTTIKRLQELRKDSKFEELFDQSCITASRYCVKTPFCKRFTIFSGKFNQENTNSKTGQNLEQKYHSLYFKLIDSVVDEIKFKFHDVLPLVWTVQIIRNVDQVAIKSLNEIGIYNGLIDFIKLENELICWGLIKKDSSLLSICQSAKLARLESLLLKFKPEQKDLKNIEEKEHNTMQPYTIHDIYEGFKQLQLKKSLIQLDLLFRIYLSIPVSSANSNKSLSVLKRINNWQQFTMSHKKPTNNLTLLNVESDLQEFINVNDAIDNFMNNEY